MRSVSYIRSVMTVVYSVLRYEIMWFDRRESKVPATCRFPFTKLHRITSQKHCTTSQNVAGLIPDGVTGILH